jgi:hypothetical protein
VQVGAHEVLGGVGGVDPEDGLHVLERAPLVVTPATHRRHSLHRVIIMIIIMIIIIIITTIFILNIIGIIIIIIQWKTVSMSSNVHPWSSPRQRTDGTACTA